MDVPEALREFDGYILPADAILLSDPPDWLKVGMEYARSVYKPLFDYNKNTKAIPGLVSLASTHPESFEAIARTSTIDKNLRRRFILAALLGKWELMERLGCHVTEKERVKEYSVASGTGLSELPFSTVKQQIIREMQRRKPPASK